MNFLSANAFLWVKALHIVSVIAWMAGLLYLPRLFVYHCQAAPGSPASETFKVMERRLYKAIMVPAMVSSYLFGILMLLNIPHNQPWLWAKLVLILLLTASHFAMAGWKKDFALDQNRRPQKFFRIANEVPTLLMIAIVILAVVKPF